MHFLAFFLGCVIAAIFLPGLILKALMILILLVLYSGT